MTATVDVRLEGKKDPTGKRSKLYEDMIVRTTSYSIGRSTQEPGYPGTVAERDAIARGLKLVADDIHLMLASYFKKWGGSEKSMPQTEPQHKISMEH